MADLMGKISTIKGQLTFGEAAHGLGLSGSSVDGWDCPACESAHSVKERGDGQGGRCNVCGEGFDQIKLVRVLNTVGAPAAVATLEHVIAAKSASKQKGFFDD